MKYHGILIGDIHFDVIEIERLKYELEESFLSYLNTLEQIDYICILGDYFDHKMYLNNSSIAYCVEFMNKLVSICKKFNAPLRIVYGTESHECNQYKIFNSMFNKDKELNWKIIYQPYEEELLPGLNVLYLPEERIYSKKHYYKDYLCNKNKYDYVFGHGIIQGVVPSNMTMDFKDEDDSDNHTKKSAPVFTAKELSYICRGQVYFGHYHVNTNINDKLFYTGSFTRWQHGENSPKGFYHVICDINKDEYKNRFIENYRARKYVTMVYGYNDPVMNSEEALLKELDKCDKLVKSHDVDFIKFEFNIPENHPNPQFIVEILNERYRYNDNVKTEVVNGYVEKRRNINKEKLKNTLDEYGMIFDKSLAIEDKLFYYIKKKYDREIPPVKIDKYINGLYTELLSSN